MLIDFYNARYLSELNPWKVYYIFLLHIHVGFCFSLYNLITEKVFSRFCKFQVYIIRNREIDILLFILWSFVHFIVILWFFIIKFFPFIFSCSKYFLNNIITFEAILFLNFLWLKNISPFIFFLLFEWNWPLHYSPINVYLKLNGVQNKIGMKNAAVIHFHI